MAAENIEINTHMKTFTHVPAQNLPVVKVQNNASGKRFYTTPAGMSYPSITTLLGHKEKPWLADWRKSLGQDKAAKETKRASERGDAIHKLIEYYLDNKLTPDILRKTNPEYVAGFNQVKLRLNKVNNIRAQEVAIYSDTLGVAGRIDCIGEYDGVLSVVDFKTSTNSKMESMIEDYFLQTTAYAIMWNEITSEPIEDVVIIMSVERSMAPLLFKEKIDKYVKPLLIRINEYYEDQK
jgi:CRISPR/Cas system-associated exonuclease Cas4 (RecB family)